MAFALSTAVTVSAARASTAGVAPAPIVPPDVAIERLKAGNARFVKGKPSRPNATPKRRAEIAGSQHPFAIVVSCSDSRVPPEMVFDAGLGDLFVVRTAGEVVTAVEMASIEYAVDHLGASLVLVMGHERCGAVKAAVEYRNPPALPLPGAPKPVAESHGDSHGDGHGDSHGDGHGKAHDDGHGDGHGQASKPTRVRETNPDFGGPKPRDHIGALINEILPAVEAAERRSRRGDLLDEAVRVQAKSMVRRLVEDSPMLKAFLVSGRLRIAAARYDLDTGEVELLR
jgi:carbonic anhydrase